MGTRRCSASICGRIQASASHEPFASLAPAQVRPEFEVASVKIVPPGNNTESYMPTLDIAPGGTLNISNRRLDEIIMLAYNIGVKQLCSELAKLGPNWTLPCPITIASLAAPA